MKIMSNISVLRFSWGKWIDFLCVQYDHRCIIVIFSNFVQKIREIFGGITSGKITSIKYFHKTYQNIPVDQFYLRHAVGIIYLGGKKLYIRRFFSRKMSSFLEILRFLTNFRKLHSLKSKFHPVVQSFLFSEEVNLFFYYDWFSSTGDKPDEKCDKMVKMCSWQYYKTLVLIVFSGQMWK